MSNNNFEIVWSNFAEKQLDGIFDYYKSRAGLRVAKKLINGIINVLMNYYFCL